MKKRLLSVLLLCGLVFLGGCGKISAPAEPTEHSEPGEVYCLVNSREEAEKVANLYGIELTDWSDGVAVYWAEHPTESIAEGIENGWPRLEINEEIEAFS